MQMTNGRGWLKLSAATAVAGALVAVAASFAVAPRYVSSAVMVVNSFMTSIRQSGSPRLTTLPASTNGGSLGDGAR